MPSDKARVIPRLPRHGLLVLCIAGGLAHGVCGAWLMVLIREFTRFGLMSFGSVIAFLLVVTLVFILPAAAFAMLINRVHPHFGRSLLYGVIYGPCGFVGILSVILTRNPGWPLALAGGSEHALGTTFAAAMGVCFGFAVVVGASVGTFALGFLIERTFGRRVLIQTGSICWFCGYNLGVWGPGTCPECGKPFDPAGPHRAISPKLLARLTKLRGPAIAIFLLIALAPIAFDLAIYSLPAIRFLRARPADIPLKNADMVGTWTFRKATFGGTNYIRPISDGWWIEDSNDPTTGVILQFFPNSRGDEPRIVASRAHLRDSGSIPQSQRWASGGPFRVFANLSPAQAEHIIQMRSVPPDLIRAIRERAAALDWQPGAPSSSRPPNGAVDPTPYLPPKP